MSLKYEPSRTMSLKYEPSRTMRLKCEPSRTGDPGRAENSEALSRGPCGPRRQEEGSQGAPPPPQPFKWQLGDYVLPLGLRTCLGPLRGSLSR